MADYGKRYESCTLDTFDASENGNALEAVRQLVAGKIAGLLIYGTVGTGKTHLCVGAGKAYERPAIPGHASEPDERGLRVYIDGVPEQTVAYWPVLDLAGAFRDAAGGSCPSPEPPCRSAGLLILDDWGAERTTDFVLEALERIVDARYRAMKPMLIATNMDPEQIMERYGDRALSRWAHEGRIVELRGRDRRTGGA
jgi:DNA replication protein DnaC